MQENNDFKMSEDFIGWNLFIPKYDWETLMSWLAEDEKKLLCKLRTGAIYFEKTKGLNDHTTTATRTKKVRRLGR